MPVVFGMWITHGFFLMPPLPLRTTKKSVHLLRASWFDVMEVIVRWYLTFFLWIHYNIHIIPSHFFFCEFVITFISFLLTFAYQANARAEMALFCQTGQIRELKRISSHEAKTRLKLGRWLLAQSEKLKRTQAEQRALKDAHEVEMHKYIDVAIFEEMKQKITKRIWWRLGRSWCWNVGLKSKQSKPWMIWKLSWIICCLRSEMLG